MSNVKPDPDAATDTPSVSQPDDTLGNAVEANIDVCAPQTTLAPGTSVLRKTPSQYQPIQPKSLIQLKPIAPKPTRPSQPLTFNNAAHPPVYVSFSLFGQSLTDVSDALQCQRALYGSTVIPKKQLRVLGHNTLRLQTVIPKSRLNAHPLRRPQQLSCSPLMVTQTCSHMLVRSGSVFPDDVPSAPEPMLDSGTLKVDDAPIKCLRPTVRLLVRLGRQLTQSQYSNMVVNECACGSVSAPVRTPSSTEPSSSDQENKTGEAKQSSVDDLLATLESTHLEWRPKTSHARWTRFRELCKSHNCPFIPATIFQLHRHLEVGHQRYMRIHQAGTDTQSSARGRFTEYSVETEQLFPKLCAPLVVNCNLQGRGRQACPVCTVQGIPLSKLLTHIKSFHPFISPQFIEKPTMKCCAVCGAVSSYPVPSGRFQTTPYNTLMHVYCTVPKNHHHQASWAAFDAHPLACLILFPNLHSRLALPSDVAAQLYRSLDFVVTSKLNTAKSLDSYTLRCSLTISAICGDLVVLDMKGQVASNEAVNAIEKETHSEKGVNGVLPELTNFTTVGSKPNVPSLNPPLLGLPDVPLLVLPSENLTNPSKDLPHSNSNLALAELSEVVTGIKRPRLESNSEGEVPTKRLSTAPTEPTDTSKVRLPNGESFKRGINDGSPTTTNGPPSEISDDPDQDVDSTVTIPCELCDTLISPSKVRSHFDEFHKRPMPNAPRDVCMCCGQLFWSVEGLVRHRSVKCTFCYYGDVCRSTLYIHMALKHMDELCARVRQLPHNCLICDEVHHNIPEHITEKHLCAVPVDVSRRLRSASNQSHLSNYLAGPNLLSLAPLYIKSLAAHGTDQSHSAISRPNHVVLRDSTNGKTFVYRCCVCRLRFATETQLDMHVLQCTHNYTCSTCSFTTNRLNILTVHMRACSKKKSGFRFIRLNNGPPASSIGEPPPATTSASVTTLPTVSSVVIRPQTTPTKPIAPAEPPPMQGIRRAVGPVSEFHGCDYCPVFCLRLEELDAHRQSVHKCPPMVQTAAATATPSASSTLLTTVLPQTVTTATPQSMVSILPQRRVVFPQTAPSRYPSVSHPTLVQTQSVGQLPMTSIVIVPRPVAAQQKIAIPPIRPTVPRPQPEKPVEDFVCPMCEFHSSSRKAVMQHLTDVH